MFLFLVCGPCAEWIDRDIHMIRIPICCSSRVLLVVLAGRGAGGRGRRKRYNPTFEGEIFRIAGSGDGGSCVLSPVGSNNK